MMKEEPGRDDPELSLEQEAAAILINRGKEPSHANGEVCARPGFKRVCDERRLLDPEFCAE